MSVEEVECFRVEFVAFKADVGERFAALFVVVNCCV